MNIREITLGDAENFIHLVKQVETESDYMLLEAGERTTTSEQQQLQLEQIIQQSNSTIFIAEDEEKLLGYIIVIGGTARRNRHSAYLVVGILKEYRGQGLGTSLFEAVNEWAHEHELSRLELTVVTENEAGIALYKKNGFEIEGTKVNSLKIDGTFHNEYYMAKLL
ncbi:GCN5 family acetyltransferase [Mesobacillus campisalis]|uniref:GCN5 family acetyltransferase n=1 Tax=Mesobacillus campisalis TaxID=1408103 RepID=A0A0M2SVN0_9BACI|nr:GNAT family N-acetyltransferase [Mesobacillus campisalis]KKK37761.1 GCN5 family acetyltransferase [Mesobacillus campisalis]